MNDRVTVAIPLAEVRSKMKSRTTPKGRQVQPAAREEIAALLAGREIRRDLLIEYLHLIQDGFEAGIVGGAALLANRPPQPLAPASGTAS